MRVKKEVFIYAGFKVHEPIAIK